MYSCREHLSFGQETSSRNSEVIHAGIYYTRTALKQNYVLKKMLYTITAKKYIPFNNCGNNCSNHTRGNCSNWRYKTDCLREWSWWYPCSWKRPIAELEPNIFAIRLFLPSTGIVDTHSLMKQYRLMPSIMVVRLYMEVKLPESVR